MIHVSSPAATLNQHWSSPTPYLIQMQKKEKKKKGRQENSVQIPPADIPSVSPRDCAGHRHNQYVLLGVKQPFDDRWGNSSHSDRFSHKLLISHSPPPLSHHTPNMLLFLFMQFIGNLPWQCMWLFEFNCKCVWAATGPHPPFSPIPSLTALAMSFFSLEKERKKERVEPTLP